MSPATRSLPPFPFGACAPGVGAELELEAELAGPLGAVAAGLPDDPQAATERAAAAVTTKMAYRMYFTLRTRTGDVLRRRWESAV